jgi:hypothetical protein
MALAEFKEAIGLLGKLPVLWIPGVVSGLLAAALWILLDISGTFFTSRLLFVALMVVMLFIAGMLAIIRNGGGGAHSLLMEGMRYYFRVLLPQLVIVCASMIAFVMLMVVATLVMGSAPDVGIMSVISFCIMIPVLLLTFFYDTAAVFEDLRVFDSIQRSVHLTITHAGEVIKFYLVCAGCCIAVMFGLMVIWEAALYERLQPLTTYNETQVASLTPDQFVALMGHDGMWLTAILICIGILLLLPVLITYKACVFRKIAGSPLIIQQQSGEYDSKGRYYKY